MEMVLSGQHVGVVKRVGQVEGTLEWMCLGKIKAHSMVLHNYHLHLLSKCFHHPEEDPTPFKQYPPFPSPSPCKYQLAHVF